jgi:ABC-2 type transport system permease protein
MREILFNSVIRSDYMLKAVIFNVIFMFIGIIIFLIAFEGARKRGALLNIGE